MLLVNCKDRVTIGVFGDSFSIFNTENLETNWFNVLKNLFSEKQSKILSIYHYGIGGSSLFDAYSKMIANADRYDLNILFVSNPGRYPIPVNEKIFRKPNFFPSINQIDYFLDHNKKLLPKKLKKKLESIKLWFDDDLIDYHNTFQFLLVDRIKHQFSNCIMIPCFENSFSSKQYDKEGYGKNNYLFRYYRNQIELLNLKPEQVNSDTEREIICGHLIPEYSETLGKIIYNKIDTERWDFKDMDNVNPKLTKYDYYDIRN